MDKEWNRALRSAIADVFATMFFIVPEWDPELGLKLASQKAGGWYEGWVDFDRAPKSLRVWVWSPPELAAELAANIMASRIEDLDEEQILDAFREMLNMVAGSLLTSMDPAGQWKMGLPQGRVLPPTPLKDLLKQVGDELAFEAEGRPFLAGLKMNGK
jgi:hypothetical protein